MAKIRVKSDEQWDAERQILYGTLLDMHDQIAALRGAKRWNERDDLLEQIRVLERQLRSKKQTISKYKNGKLPIRRKRSGG